VKVEFHTLFAIKRSIETNLLDDGIDRNRIGHHRRICESPRSSTQGDQFQAEKVNFLITPAFKATFLPARLGEI